MLCNHKMKQTSTEQLTINPVHGNGDGLVRLPRDGSQGHAACAEALHDVLCRLHLIQIHFWAYWLQAQSVSQNCYWRIVLVVLVCLVGFLQCKLKQRSPQS